MGFFFIQEAPVSTVRTLQCFKLNVWFMLLSFDQPEW